MNFTTDTRSLVIGGTSGIGRAVAEELKRRPGTVETASRSTGLDVTVPASVHTFFAALPPQDHIVFTAGSWAPIRAHVVSPGLTDTGVAAGEDANAHASMIAQAASGLPTGTVGTADDLAHGYLFAIDNPYVTGAVIDIDGGSLIK